MKTTLTINGEQREIEAEARVTLLDALRHDVGLTGTKTGCDHGQCGACTVIVDGRRINSCLTLLCTQEGAEVTTIEGLGEPGRLSALQEAFLAQDGFQCGYCTPGQICSATAMIEEAAKGWPSWVSEDLEGEAVLSREEISERMSGNLCRCACYPNIVEAIAKVADARMAEAAE
ncbi:(2Fe-2S)-binding protein [Cereibacter sphaeroides]|uniref:2Fe-2S iron-sulfur cluster-binding protein n=1 Tax=Cereibacter sphaeroides TaxID=1063 RepID=UPI000F52D5C5|nr:2Fe-2S iron-sulfur cluster-binding protein [Cereibacter sphaeroides]AZB57107.1 (2Fe-2S)-binding protein [Cereibacter sphaeroides]AZB61387.1 (2Fe-2S)-binding protein [Cereibacter sphaeroides]